MLFNSPEFLIFLLIVYFLYLVLPFRSQNYMLLFASYIFYGWWDARFLFLIVISTVVDFWVGLMIEIGRLSRPQRLVPAIYFVVFAVFLLGLNLNGSWSAINPNLEFSELVESWRVLDEFGG